MVQVKFNFLLKLLSWQNWYSHIKYVMLIYQMFFNNVKGFRNFVGNLVVFSCAEQEEIDHQVLYSFLHLFSSSILFSFRREESVSLRAVDPCEGEYALSRF